MPIQLEFGLQWSTEALENVIDHGNEISSLALHCDVDPTPLLHQLVTLSGPSIERLGVYSESGWWGEEPTADEVWRGLPSLRELFAYRYPIQIYQLAAPNLVHLAMEQGGCSRDATIQSILNMLRGCPLLETLLIIHPSSYPDIINDHSPVSLPHLRSIELGAHEVNSGLITYLQYPPGVAVGLRTLIKSDLCGEISPSVMATTQYVLGRIDIYSITLAVPPPFQEYSNLIARFEGLRGSLEVTACEIAFRADTGAQFVDGLFGPEGVLFSHSPRIEVRELHIVGCAFGDGQGLRHISVALPNVVSISFFGCGEPRTLGLVPTNPSSLPFPHLERIMVLGPTLGLREMVEARRDHGIPLKTIVIGRGHVGFEYDHLEDYSGLGEIVSDLRVGCPTEILEWGVENEILKVWSMVEVPGPVSPTGNPIVIVQG